MILNISNKNSTKEFISKKSDEITKVVGKVVNKVSFIIGLGFVINTSPIMAEEVSRNINSTQEQVSNLSEKKLSIDAETKKIVTPPKFNPEKYINDLILINKKLSQIQDEKAKNLHIKLKLYLAGYSRAETKEQKAFDYGLLIEIQQYMLDNFPSLRINLGTKNNIPDARLGKKTVESLEKIVKFLMTPH